MIGSHLFRIQEVNDHIIVYIVDDMSTFCTGVHCRMYLDLNLRLVYIHSVQGVLSKFLLYHYQWYDKIFFFQFWLKLFPKFINLFWQKTFNNSKMCELGQPIFFFFDYTVNVWCQKIWNFGGTPWDSQDIFFNHFSIFRGQNLNFFV